jgi:hypothetical protein
MKTVMGSSSVVGAALYCTELKALRSPDDILLLDHDVQRQSGQKLKKKKEKIVFNEPNE